MKKRPLRWRRDSLPWVSPVSLWLTAPVLTFELQLSPSWVVGSGGSQTAQAQQICFICSPPSSLPLLQTRRRSGLSSEQGQPSDSLLEFQYSSNKILTGNIPCDSMLYMYYLVIPDNDWLCNVVMCNVFVFSEVCCAAVLVLVRYLPHLSPACFA